MALYISNIASLRAQNSFNKTTRALDTTYQRLSTGLRINSAKDDAAGLQIANRMTSQINGLKQANRNASDGVALAQTIEGALDEITNMLQKIRTLSIQAANGVNTTADRLSINEEVRQYCEEITRISCSTTYGGAKILCGLANSAGHSTLLDSRGAISLQVGPNANNTISITGLDQGFSLSAIANMAGIASATGYNTDDGYARFSMTSAEGAQSTLGIIDRFISVVDSKRGSLGAVQNRLESAIRLNETMHINMSDARSRIMETDYAEEASNLASLSILQQVAVAMMQRINSSKDMILKLLS
ncbi:MAG: flagellin [Succinivibrio sp.]|nr:flagellin [Succinivibrio sp.]